MSLLPNYFHNYFHGALYERDSARETDTRKHKERERERESPTSSQPLDASLGQARGDGDHGMGVISFGTKEDRLIKFLLNKSSQAVSAELAALGVKLGRVAVLAHLSLHALLLAWHEVIEGRVHEVTRARVGVAGPSRSTASRHATKTHCLHEDLGGPLQRLAPPMRQACCTLAKGLIEAEGVCHVEALEAPYAIVLDQGPSFKLHNAGCMQLHQHRVDCPDKMATLRRYNNVEGLPNAVVG